MEAKTEDKAEKRNESVVQQPEESEPPARRRGAVESFKYAVDGILDVFRTQKHMRFHFITVVVVLLVALMFNLTKRDMLILLFTISLVLMAEMFNSAIEAVVDLITTTYHPLAKFAKDAAAGAVLISTVTAVIVGVLLSAEYANYSTSTTFEVKSQGMLTKVFMTGVLLIVVITIVKFLGTRGKLLKGGIASGHTAAGFFLALAILYLSKNSQAAILAMIMALLIAQSRVEAKIHSLQEVITGALIALLVSAVVFWLTPVSW